MTRAQSKAAVITFIGPVGVGKSTQMALTRKHLETRGFETKIAFVKSSHGFTYVFLRILKTICSKEKIRYGDTVRTYPRRDILRKLFVLYRLLDIPSITLKFIGSVCLPYSAGSVVLLEEGPIMSLHTYAEVLPKLYGTPPTSPAFVPNMIGWIENRNHLNLILEADEAELKERRKTRNFRRTELPEYEKLQKNWIRRLNLRNTIFINTTGIKPSDVQNLITASLKDNCFIESNEGTNPDQGSEPFV